MIGILNTPTGHILLEDDHLGRYLTKVSAENLILKKEITRLRIINLKQLIIKQ